MNDRFKFRAINMQTKEITYIDSFYWFEENGVSEIDHNNTGSGSFAEYWITQCTGLKDKNGKLIYEGDIVEVSLKHLDNQKCIEIVKWDNVSVRFQFEKLGQISVYNFAETWEVIGNIYENKELLI